VKNSVTFLFFYLTANFCLAQRDTLIFPPSLQLSFPEKTWIRYINYTKAMFMPGTLSFQDIHNEEMQMEVQSGEIRELYKPPDKIIEYLLQDSEGVKSQDQFTKNDCSVISSQYLKDNGNDDNKTEYVGYTIFKYNFAYFAFISLNAPIKLKAQLKSALDDLLNSIYLLTPDIIDKKEGLPITGRNYDSLLVKEQESELQKIKKQYGISELDSETEEIAPQPNGSRVI
jgi:hypothetical protein